MNENLANNRFSLFPLFFGGLYFLLFILTENFSSLWVSPFILLLYALSLGLLLWRTKEKIPRSIAQVCILIACFLSVFLLLTPFALSVPAAVLRWVTLGLAGATAIYFLGTSHFDQAKQSVSNMLVAVHAVFLPLTFIVFLSKTLQTLSPAGSILNFTVGQNHVYVLYLIAIPLCVERYLHNSESTQNTFSSIKWIILSTCFGLGILFSFSRVGILLLGVELLYLLLVVMSHHKTAIQRSLWLLFLGVTLIWLVFMSFTLNPRISFGTDCKAPILQEQLCKSFSADHRLDYWRQALSGIVSMPIWGNGGGSFSFTSFQYRQSLDAYSAYPHNEYLQLIGEYGIFGLGFVLCYLASILVPWRYYSKLERHTQLLLLISTLLAADSLLNFNWNFSGILVAEAIVWAVMFRQFLLQIQPLKKQQWPTVVIIISLLAIAVPMTWFSVMFIKAELAAKNDFDSYFSTFPYFSWRAHQAVLSSSTSESTKILINNLYQNDVSVMSIVAEQQTDPRRRLVELQHLRHLDRRNPQVHIKVLILALQENMPNEVMYELEWLLSFYSLEDRYKVGEFEPAYLDRLITYANQLSVTDATTSARITKLAYQFEPWKVNRTKTQFFITPEKFPDHLVVELLNSFPSQYLWSYVDSLNSWSWGKMTIAAQNGEWDTSQQYERLLLQHSDWDPKVVWTQLSQIFSNRLANIPSESPTATEEKASVIGAWRDSLATIQKFGKVGGIPVDISGWNSVIDSAQNQ